ncbi:uncharacterized protein SPSK_09217 [Sporothrix schenckii 1099-18]|uniref:N-acetyltransferase domain-containing protein n=1 Tax=Sporothrix schenckii 1099-18 TaxID=1397361 RepID=A0A0F2M8S0_SPOSC|nr:uncharacterized protein SPSK_09217 [Sporothrix schenckii 1099-18]KJR85474.1 hypothetical protein SPSK_09217 [Sporothrix schenckii 1099-18]
MPPNQRSILSFFGSSSSNELPKPQPQAQPQLQPTPASSHSLPQPQFQPRPPPPSSSRFVPPPSARNGNGYTPPPNMAAMRSGGSPEHQVKLAPITPAYGRSILQNAGATDLGDGNIGFASSYPSNKIVFPRDIHIPDLVSVNAILLPVRYPDSFYKFVTDTSRLASLFNRIVLGDDGKVVGGIVCLLEPSPFAKGRDAAATGASTGLAVYVRSLGLLSPYRGRGLMTAAMDSIVATAQALNQRAAVPGGPLASTGPVQSVFAHVWTEHDDAVAWYAARKFVREGDAPIENYYFALRPATAWLVRRDVPDTATSGDVSGDASVAQLVRESTQRAKIAASAAQATPPPPQPPLPPPNGRSQSYQNSRPETEWNDLPADMMGSGPSTNASTSASVASSRNPSRKVSQNNLADRTTASTTTTAAAENGDSLLPSGTSALLAPPPASGSQASSRSSSSTGRKKRERAYPAAMFQ